MEIIRTDELQEFLDVVRVNPYGEFLIILLRIKVETING